MEHPELTTLLPLQCFLADRCFFTPPCRAFPIVIRHLENVLTLHLFFSLFLSNSWLKKKKKKRKRSQRITFVESIGKTLLLYSFFFLFSFATTETWPVNIFFVRRSSDRRESVEDERKIKIVQRRRRGRGFEYPRARFITLRRHEKDIDPVFPLQQSAPITARILGKSICVACARQI